MRRGIAIAVKEGMLSRKEFFRDLLGRGIRAAEDLAAAADPPASGLSRDPFCGAAETELSPALLAIEAECRGLEPGLKDPAALRRAIYRELARRTPPSMPQGGGEGRAPCGAEDPEG